VTAIAGIWNHDGRGGAADACRRMLASQQMYGPHDTRHWSDGGVAMGRQLFRTVPEDAWDRQPLRTKDGRLTLVADIRIDNREELAGELAIGLGESARLPDAALLLFALERWGEDALDRVVGDFGFALWNATDRTLMLARDYLGQRPLHYHAGKGFFAFATMPKGLHALPEVPYAPDEQAVAELLALLPQTGPSSFFKGIERVEAGHVVRVTRDGVQSRCYWNPARPAAGNGSGRDWAEGLRHHLDSATRSRLRGATGGVASHLSAGLDSSAVTATAARLLGPESGRVTAFTAVPNEGYAGTAPANRIGDEGPLAAATAAMYPNVDHVLVRSGLESPLEDLDRSFLLFERPILNLCNWVWTRAINDRARELGLNVMLTGTMGNMSLSYAGFELIPELLRKGQLLRAASEAGALLRTRRSSRKAVAALALGPFMPTPLWRLINKAFGRNLGVQHHSALRSECLESMGLRRLASERQLDFTYRPRRDGFDTRLWVLRRIDIGNYGKGMLAGWGVDHRDPTADRRLVEYCLSVPMEQYLARGEPRALALRALSDRLPREVIAERKRGLQAMDWHEGLTAARAEVAVEVGRLAACAPASQVLDLERMRLMVENWPDSGWQGRSLATAYRYALLRGIASGHFLRRASGTNA